MSISLKMENSNNRNIELELLLVCMRILEMERDISKETLKAVPSFSELLKISKDSIDQLGWGKKRKKKKIP